MSRFSKFLCQIGIHDWGPWQDIGKFVPTHVFHDYQRARCSHCQKEKRRSINFELLG